jgi:hypothetical protein
MNQVHKFLIYPVKASSIIGTNVVNPKGDNLGSIKDIVIDRHTGRVAYAVVSFGGFLGMGEKLFAIPFSAFAFNMTKNQFNNEYVLNLPRERLDAAPGFDQEHWPSMIDEKWNRDMHKYYERPPYWE